jgi:hypothetical protein
VKPFELLGCPTLQHGVEIPQDLDVEFRTVKASVIVDPALDLGIEHSGDLRYFKVT